MGSLKGGCYVNAKRRSIKKENFVKNWEFYLNFPKMLQCGDHEIPTYDVNGEEGKFGFLCLENGLFIPTKELDLVIKVQEGKMSVNLQMKLWAEDIGIMLMPNELYEYCKEMPFWVYKGTIEQSKKRIMKEIGFMPTFLKNSFDSI